VVLMVYCVLFNDALDCCG